MGYASRFGSGDVKTHIKTPRQRTDLFAPTCREIFTIRNIVAEMLISLGHSKTFINQGRKKAFFLKQYSAQNDTSYLLNKNCLKRKQF